MSIKRFKLKSKNNRGEDDPYSYLLFKRPNEKISRVDRYSIVLYWSDYDENSNPVIKHELFFYPSEYGMQEIRKYSEGETSFGTLHTKGLVHRLDQLMKYGNPWWHHDTNIKLTPEMWILNENIKPDLAATYKEFGYTPNIKPSSNNKIKKVKLKIKPQRVRLKTK